MFLGWNIGILGSEYCDDVLLGFGGDGVVGL